MAPARSVLFPYVQLSPELRLGLWAEVLASARAIGLVSAAERPLMRRLRPRAASPTKKWSASASSAPRDMPTRGTSRIRPTTR